MAKTVQLSERAYKALYLLKRDGDSFSDVVDRLVRERKDPERLRDLSDPEEAKR